MRPTFLALVGFAPMAACSDAFVTAPPEVAAAPAAVPLLRGILVVDGVAVLRGDINPADIERVEIIKGAAAAALYGTGTRCPPIIIRTRRPSPAPPPAR